MLILILATLIACGLNNTRLIQEYSYLLDLQETIRHFTRQ